MIYINYFKTATYYYQPIDNGEWEINECGVLRNKKTKQMKKSHDNVKDVDKHQRVTIKHKQYYLSRIIAEAFVENDDTNKNIIVRHLDDNPLNNYYKNLKWGTPQENTFDAIRNGKIVYDEKRNYTSGEKHPNHKLTEKEVVDICDDLLFGVDINDISKKYSQVSRDEIVNIYQRRAWRSISKKYDKFPKQNIRSLIDPVLHQTISEYVFNHPNEKAMQICDKLNIKYDNRNKNLIRKYRKLYHFI